VAVADLRNDAAGALAESLTCNAYSSYEEMADNVELDAVLICTPPSTHPDIAINFLNRKIHVLCEKPLCIDLANARQMVDAAERNGVMLNMASKFRYVDDVIRARSIILSRILGEIILFENAFTARVDMSTRWNSDPILSGGGVLIDNGTHSLDLMRYLLGPLAELQVVEGKRSQKLPVDETVHIFARTVEGVMGSIDLSWSINKELDSYARIYGTDGTIVLNWKEAKYRQSGSREWCVFGTGYDKLQGLRNQMQNFAGAIKNREPLLTSSEDALASVEVMETAYTALHRSQWVRIEGGILA
jgi:predicted dehydrogenase